jgi:hypothetical protein
MYVGSSEWLNGLCSSVCVHVSSRRFVHACLLFYAVGKNNVYTHECTDPRIQRYIHTHQVYTRAIPWLERERTRNRRVLEHVLENAVWVPGKGLSKCVDQIVEFCQANNSQEFPALLLVSSVWHVRIHVYACLFECISHL